MGQSTTELELKTKKMSREPKLGEILDKTPPEKAFYFYTGINQFTGVSSHDLTDFCDKIRAVDIKSIEFHVARGDFEAWIRYLGDAKLERKLRFIREMGLMGEALRERLHITLRSRCDELGRQKPKLRTRRILQEPRVYLSLQDPASR